MMATEVKDLLQRAWKDQWAVEHWMFEVNQHINTLDDELSRSFMFQLTGKLWTSLSCYSLNPR